MGKRLQVASKQKKKGSLGKYMKQNWQYYVLLFPAFLFGIIFYYIPLGGIQIAFRDYNIRDGFFGSEWVGLKHLIRFMTGDKFLPLIKNTLEINLAAMAANLIIPIIIAIMLNELRLKKLKKPMQMVLYAPHFVSTIAVCGIITLFTQRETGLINLFIHSLISSLSHSTLPAAIFLFFVTRM